MPRSCRKRSSQNSQAADSAAPDGPAPDSTAADRSAPDSSPLRTKRQRKAAAKQQKEQTKQHKLVTQQTAKQEKQITKRDKLAAKAAKAGEHGRVTPSNAKKLVGVAKVVGPVLAPYAMRAATSARQSYDRARAQRLGVPVDDLGKFTGRGAGLHARIAGDQQSLEDLRTRVTGLNDDRSLAVEQFAETAQGRLSQLTSVVRAAERMPTGRRRSAHRAVTAELDRIEDDLLQRLGI